MRITCADLPVSLTIAGWKTKHQNAQDALQTMLQTHYVNYLRMYDAFGNLIYPDQYEEHLKGALAWMMFTIKHRIMPDIGEETSYRDVFIADIVKVITLES